jgi:hypothetical protein
MPYPGVTDKGPCCLSPHQIITVALINFAGHRLHLGLMLRPLLLVLLTLLLVAMPLLLLLLLLLLWLLAPQIKWFC